MRNRVWRCAVAAAAVILVGCGRRSDPQPPIDQAASFVSLRDSYFVRTLRWNPVTATYLGADEYRSDLRDANGRLRDYSEESLAQEIAYYRNAQQELRAIETARLPPALVVDSRLMDAHLKFLLRNLADRKYYQRAVDTYTSEPFR